MSSVHTQSSYGEERNPNEEIRLTRAGAWTAIVAFLLLICVPPVLREVSGDGLGRAFLAVLTDRSGTLADRLRGFERIVDRGDWVQPFRKGAQSLLTCTLREGNRKVFIDDQGRYFLRPGLRALTSYGPIAGEPESVDRDPTAAHWEPPLPIIREFARQLGERGIELVLVPIPDKAAVWSSADPKAPLPRHPAAQAFYRDLAAAGVRLVDLSHWLSLPGIDHTTRGFLAQDTHWNPAGMRAAAREIARQLGHPAPAPLGNPAAAPAAPAATSQHAFGDLVRKLELLSPGRIVDPEAVSLVPSPLTAFSEPASPVVLIGDSFVNIFEDADLGWAAAGCGFGAHLAHALGQPLHVIGVNGGGSSECREQFARLPDPVVRAKKTVIWVIAERDLFLSASPARENDVVWRHVEFNRSDAAAVSGEPLVIDVTLRQKSTLQDPVTFEYDDAVYTAEFTVDRVASGSYPPAEAVVVLWNFRKRQVQPSARFQAGQRFRLTVVPWDSKKEFARINPSDDFLRFDLPLLYAEKIESLP